jgi:CheY-like chemotaxis protein
MAKILLVEDDNNLREIFEMRLQAEGYSTVTAGDGEEALVVAMKEKPDLIIADVMMPKLSGFEMLETLRAAPEMKDVKVVMMTALGQAEDRARGEKLGVVKYLVKSQVTLEDFARVVKEVMQAGTAPAEATPPPGGSSQVNDSSTTNKQESENSMQEDTAPTNPAPTGDSGSADANPISGGAPAPADSGGMSTAQEQDVVTNQINDFVASSPAAPPAPAGDMGAAPAPATDPTVPSVDPATPAPAAFPGSDSTPPATPPAEPSAPPEPYVPPTSAPPSDSPQPPTSDQPTPPATGSDNSGNTI